jgi:SAM-dependent methyltransferase
MAARKWNGVLAGRLSSAVRRITSSPQAYLQMSLIASLLQHWRKPTGTIGKAAVWAMNMSHSGLTEWGISQVPIGRGWAILEVGCGGGMAVRKMASMTPDGKVCGIDYSEASVLQSRRTNRDQIKSGRVDIRQGAVSSLPYPDGVFDLVTAIDSHYYWPDLTSDLHEVQRVLKQGGYVAIIGEGYRGGVFDRLYRAWAQQFNVTETSAQGLAELLSIAGFSASKGFTNSKTSWICALARKP